MSSSPDAAGSRSNAERNRARAAALIFLVAAVVLVVPAASGYGEWQHALHYGWPGSYSSSVSELNAGEAIWKAEIWGLISVVVLIGAAVGAGFAARGPAAGLAGRARRCRHHGRRRARDRGAPHSAGRILVVLGGGGRALRYSSLGVRVVGSASARSSRRPRRRPRSCRETTRASSVSAMEQTGPTRASASAKRMR